MKNAKSYFIEKFSSFASQPFVTNVIIVALGPIFSQVLSTLLSPIYSRLYSPDDFGALGVFLSILSVLVPIANLSLSYAIILPKEDKGSVSILRLNLFLGLIFSFVILIVIGFFAQPISSLLNFQDYTSYLYLLPPALFFTIATIAYDEWMIRKKEFKTYSIIVMAQSILSNASQLVMGFFTPMYASLIGVNTFARGFHALVAWIKSNRTIREISPNKESQRSRSKYKQILKDYKDFPLFRTPQILVNTLNINLPIILFSSFAGTTVTGLFSYAQRILKLPTIVIADSIGKVFLQRFTMAAQKRESLQPMIIKATLILIAIGVVIFGLFAAFGPPIFAFVFGEVWLDAGIYARWMSISVLISFCSVPVVMAIPILGLQKQYLIFEVINLVVNSAGLIIGLRMLNSEVAAIAISSFAGALISIVWIIFVIIQSKNLNRYVITSDNLQRSNN